MFPIIQSDLDKFPKSICEIYLRKNGRKKETIIWGLYVKEKVNWSEIMKQLQEELKCEVSFLESNKFPAIRLGGGDKRIQVKDFLVRNGFYENEQVSILAYDK